MDDDKQVPTQHNCCCMPSYDRNQLRENNSLREVVKDHEKCTENAETVEYQHKREIAQLQVSNLTPLPLRLICLQLLRDAYETNDIVSQFLFGVIERARRSAEGPHAGKGAENDVVSRPTPF